MKGIKPIGLGKFEASKASIEKLLSELNLLEDRTYLTKYPSDLPAMVRKMNYHDAWKYCIEQKLYDFRLVDHGLIQLTVAPDISYSFLEAPLSAMTFEEFGISVVGEDWHWIAEDIREGYEQYLSSEIEEKPATPVRYDYDETGYREGVHPAGHMHFGLDNQVRVCVRRAMSPISFVLFIVRQFYPRQWEALLSQDQWKTMRREIRELAEEVSTDFFTGNDVHELHLA